MEQPKRGRRKKLIRAIETSRGGAHDRPTCSECTDALKDKRGCNRPGERPREIKGPPFVYTSPSLQNEEDRILKECPVGFMLRESSHTYDTLDACSLIENATPSELMSMSRYFQHAARLYRSETARLEELRMNKEKAGRDAVYARQVLRNR